MGKKIRIVPVLILLMLTVVGCGRQGKVSERKYVAALEAFEEYYKDELQDDYEYIVARIYMDAEGMPLMFVMASDQPESYDSVYDFLMFACVKGKVVSVMEYSGMDYEMDGGIGIGLYTDGIISVAQCSERREEYKYSYEEYIEKEQTWYQIRGDKCMEIARRDLRNSGSGGSMAVEYDEGEELEDEQDYEREVEVNPGEIRFVLGKKEYPFNLYGDDLKERDKIYKKMCDKLYSRNARGSKACQLWWKEELVRNEDLPYLFMQSLPFSNNLCYDAKSFRRQISDLKKQGSKSPDEFLIWDIDEDTKKGYGVGRDAYYLVYRDPLLLNESDLIIKKWDEDDSYHQSVLNQLIFYVMATEDYRIVEQLDFVNTISLKTMKKQVGRHLQYYLTQQDEDDLINTQLWDDDRRENSLGIEWFCDAASDMLEENLKGENSAVYLRAYIKYLMKKKESIRDKFETQEMVLSAYAYVGKKDSRLKGAGFVIGQLGEESELCLLTDRGIITYEHGRIYNYVLDDDETYYWNEVTNELLFIESGDHQWGPWIEFDEWGLPDAAFMNPEEWNDTFLYQFRSVESGRLQPTCDYYLNYEAEEGYIRDWQESENPEYEKMDWEECLDSLWQRRCGSAYEESGMEKEELDWATPLFCNQLNLEDKRQSTVRIYYSVDKACELFLKSGKANIEVIEPAEKQEKKGKDADGKDENNKKTRDEEPVKDIYAPVQTTPSADYEEELPPEAASALSEIDVETEVAQIRAWFSETQSNLSEYTLETPETGVERYDSGDGSVKIVLAKGFGGRNYERDYYFHDGELYFAFVFNGGEEHRLYFSYGPLIRYIDENKNTYDYGNTEAFGDWAAWVSEEAEEYF